MSRVPCQNGGMKIKNSFNFGPVPSEIVAKFGRVRLVRKPDGRHVFIGGNTDQRVTARQWCSQHAPFVILEPPLPRAFHKLGGQLAAADEQCGDADGQQRQSRRFGNCGNNNLAIG